MMCVVVVIATCMCIHNPQVGLKCIQHNVMLLPPWVLGIQIQLPIHMPLHVHTQLDSHTQLVDIHTQLVDIHTQLDIHT